MTPPTPPMMATLKSGRQETGHGLRRHRHHRPRPRHRLRKTAAGRRPAVAAGGHSTYSRTTGDDDEAREAPEERQEGCARHAHGAHDARGQRYAGHDGEEEGEEKEQEEKVDGQTERCPHPGNRTSSLARRPSEGQRKPSRTEGRFSGERDFSEG